MSGFWTVEEVADFLEIDKAKVYESRRRNEYPGVLGRQRGRRLMFPADLVQAGPTEPETTNDPTTAILWALEGIHTTLRGIHNELRAQRPQWVELVTEETISTTIELEEE